MKIDSIKIKNFRGYKDETKIELNDLTVFVGKNDIGKSTILEALDIFFNDGKGVIKLDKTDVNVRGKKEEDLDIEISVCFSELPEKIIIDSTVETSLQDEFMLNADGQLEVIKRYKNGGAAKVFIKAKHPTNGKCAELNFFRAEAERRCQEQGNTGVIYAIEEPETSQHSDNQRILIEAFKTLASVANTQVILTTHSSYIVKQLQFTDLRLIKENEEGNKEILGVLPGQLQYPSLNEVNYIAFNEVTEEYHDELYSFIEFQGWKSSYIQGKPTRLYKRIGRNTSYIFNRRIIHLS